MIINIVIIVIITPNIIIIVLARSALDLGSSV